MTNDMIKVQLEARSNLIQARNSLQEQIDLVDKMLKDELLSRAVEELSVAGKIIRYKEVTSNRFDTSRFKSDLGEQLYQKYCSPSVSMRFTIS